MISFGRPRTVLPTQNLGLEYAAQRKVAESAGRAAKKAQISISVDAFHARLWTRNPRGTVQCPCSSRAIGYQNTPVAPTNSGRIILDSGQGDDIEAVDSGYPLDGATPSPTETLPVGEENVPTNSWIDSIGRLLLGDGRRCALCWGTGWIDGHHLWGGQRFLCCAVSTPWTTLDFTNSQCDVDLDSPTPTFEGPGTITWDIQSLPNLNILDALRIRTGENPACSSGWTLTVYNAANPSGIDINTFLGAGITIGQSLSSTNIPTKFVLNLQEGVRVSHLEMVMRSENLINVQLPNLTLTASTELVQPFIQEEFEIDPKIAWLERGSILEIPGINGRLGSVWLVQDVVENRTAEGLTWNITGSARNVQPNEIFACVSMEDALTIGIMDYGLGTRGLESTEAGEPSGLDDETDESLAAVKRGSEQRAGGGSSTFSGTISLTPINEEE